MITYKGRQIPDTFEEIVDPKHTALIVHEMLNDFCHKDGAYSATIPGNTLVRDVPGLLGPTVNLVDEARRAGVKVIYVGWTNYPDNSSRADPEIQANYKSIMDGTYIMQRCLFEGTWGHDVIDELKPQEGDLVLNKYKRDAFAGTSLESILQWNGIKTFIIVGIGVHSRHRAHGQQRREQGLLRGCARRLYDIQRPGMAGNSDEVPEHVGHHQALHGPHRCVEEPDLTSMRDLKDLLASPDGLSFLESQDIFVQQEDFVARLRDPVNPR